jgi:ubiquinol-cytochrome c reductase cytochrome c1 subunit
MKKLIALMLLAVSGGAFAAGETVHFDHWPDARGTDLASLQNGAKLFANYCVNCHTASLMRWNRLHDIGLDDKQIKDLLIFGNQKVGDTITIAANPRDQKAWFGKTPPDLSVIARARTSFEYRGVDYLYALFRGYYRDTSTLTGWNNIAYPNIAMPHVFWERQGPREATITRIAHAEGEGAHGMERIVTVFDVNGNKSETKTPLEHGDEGIEVVFKPVDEKAAAAYDSDVVDLVAYLNFMTDPSAGTRQRIGVWVLLFMAVFAVAAWRLNAVYWKKVK